MSAELRSLLMELDGALVKASDSRHLAFLRQVTDLFVGGAASFSDDHVAIFDDVIDRLMADTDDAARIELSNRLTPIRNAPANVMVRLANDNNPAVAVPVLRKSLVLTDEALAEIIRTKSHKHLCAIAERAQLSVPVTDVLIERGNIEVSCKLAANLGAQFSELGYAKLLNRANSSKVLVDALANRNDLPPELQPFLKLAIEAHSPVR